MSGSKVASRLVVANPFAGYAKAPTESELNRVLASARQLWYRLLEELADDLNLTATEWNTSSPRRGWSFRVKRGERIIVYLSPLPGSFQASFLLGDKALRAALASGLPSDTLALIRNASKCAVGTGVRVEVHGAKDIAVVKKLAEAKLTN